MTRISVPSSNRSRAAPCTWMKNASTGSASQSDLEALALQQPAFDGLAVRIFPAIHQAFCPRRQSRDRSCAESVFRPSPSPDRQADGRAARKIWAVGPRERYNRLVIAELTKPRSAGVRPDVMWREDSFEKGPGIITACGRRGTESGHKRFRTLRRGPP